MNVSPPLIRRLFLTGLAIALAAGTIVRGDEAKPAKSPLAGGTAVPVGKAATSQNLGRHLIASTANWRRAELTRAIY